MSPSSKFASLVLVVVEILDATPAAILFGASASIAESREPHLEVQAGCARHRRAVLCIEHILYLATQLPRCRGISCTNLFNKYTSERDFTTSPSPLSARASRPWW